MLWRHLGRPAARGADKPGTRDDGIGPARRLLPLLLFLVTPAPALGQTDFPALTGRVVDEADLLDTKTERRLAALLEAHEAETTNQVVVVTLPTLQDRTIEHFGRELGNHWGIGQAGRNNGVLLIVAMQERKVRIEVGTGLESVLTDGLASAIIENEITPQFRLGRFDKGVSRGTTAILQAIEGRYEDDAPTWPLGQIGKDTLLYIVMTLFVVVSLYAFYLAYKEGAASEPTGNRFQAPGPPRRRGNPDDREDWLSDGSLWLSDSNDDDWGSGGGGGFSGGGGGFGGGGATGSW